MNARIATDFSGSSDEHDAIAISGLVKRFGDVTALDGLTMSVRQGEVHGFLGPNGAGKSTTLRILLGLLRGDGGMVTLLGGDPWRDAVSLHRRMAYVPGDVQLWPNLTGGEVIDLLGSLRGGLDQARRGVGLPIVAVDAVAGDVPHGRLLALNVDAHVKLQILTTRLQGVDPLGAVAEAEDFLAGGDVLGGFRARGQKEEAGKREQSGGDAGKEEAGRAHGRGDCS